MLTAPAGSIFRADRRDRRWFGLDYCTPGGDRSVRLPMEHRIRAAKQIRQMVGVGKAYTVDKVVSA
jgi:hypothetical protein